MSRPLREPSRRKTLLFAAALAIVPSAAAAETKEPDDVEPSVALRHDLRIDVPVTLGLGAGIVVWSFVKDDVLADRCTWCESDLNGVDAFFRKGIARRDTTPAHTVSDVTTYGIAPVVTLGLTGLAANVEHRVDETPLDGLIIAESTAIALTLDAGLGVFLRRERPYVHAALDEETKRQRIDDGGGLDSFPSGHTTATFAMAASAGTVATMRGYRLAPLVWLSSGAIALATGYLRIAADRAYFTYTATGAVLGTVTGIAVPLLFHGPREPKWMQGASISVGPRSFSFGRSF